MAAHQNKANKEETGGEGIPTASYGGAGIGPGEKIGPYKLLRILGEGGYGIVYLAEQHRPVKRRVALKVIKPGMDTKQVIARFEAERQALALLDHPNIAHVFSAGTTEAGRPYFAMEYVKGDPITEHWDRCRLTDCERPGSTIYLADNEDGPWRAIIRNATDSGFTKCDVFLPTHLPNSDTQTIGEGRRVARARHRNGCNVLYLDWHADWMGAEDMTVDMWKFKNSN